MTSALDNGGLLLMGGGLLIAAAVMMTRKSGLTTFFQEFTDNMASVRIFPLLSSEGEQVAFNTQPLDPNRLKQKIHEHLISREGYENTVYLDSLGKPTVGVGHLVLPEDNLKLGDTISDERVNELLERDAAKAIHAAYEQADEAGVHTDDFIIALVSVNFQLGTNWTSTFKNTWGLIVSGNYGQAIKNLRQSKWYKQTPVRVNDFIKSLKRLQSKGFV